MNCIICGSTMHLRNTPTSNHSYECFGCGKYIYVVDNGRLEEWIDTLVFDNCGDFCRQHHCEKIQFKHDRPNFFPGVLYVANYPLAGQVNFMCTGVFTA